MDKKQLSESDICDKFIRPAMERAGWHGLEQISREYPLRAGRVVVRGAKAQRDKSTVLRADYALFYKTNIPLRDDLRQRLTRAQTQRALLAEALVQEVA